MRDRQSRVMKTSLESTGQPVTLRFQNHEMGRSLAQALYKTHCGAELADTSL